MFPLLLGATGATAQVADRAANPHEGSPAAIRAGRALFANRCAECHGGDATGISGPDLTTLWATAPGDGRVFRTIRAGVTGSIMPSTDAPTDEVWAIVAYLKSIGTVSPDEFATGDVERGGTVYQTNCARCHRVGGQGRGLGPDLSRITRVRSRASLTQALRDPSETVAVGYRTVRLITRDGVEITGVKKREDVFSLQVVDTSERLQGFLRADLSEVEDVALSLMPVFDTDRLSDRDLDDLFRYLAAATNADIQ
ncbi:MAG: c-type cytochrome [Acidobacteriota bacterium]|nr:c-type cytochrome [Acidobacteriota bacterium]